MRRRRQAGFSVGLDPKGTARANKRMLGSRKIRFLSGLPIPRSFWSVSKSSGGRRLRGDTKRRRKSKLRFWRISSKSAATIDSRTRRTISAFTQKGECLRSRPRGKRSNLWFIFAALDYDVLARFPSPQGGGGLKRRKRSSSTGARAPSGNEAVGISSPKIRSR